MVIPMKSWSLRAPAPLMTGYAPEGLQKKKKKMKMIFSLLTVHGNSYRILEPPSCCSPQEWACSIMAPEREKENENDFHFRLGWMDGSAAGAGLCASICHFSLGGALFALDGPPPSQNH